MNPLFSYDSQKFVYQPYAEIPPQKLPKKPFSLTPPKKVDKSKKDLKKQKDQQDHPD